MPDYTNGHMNGHGSAPDETTITTDDQSSPRKRPRRILPSAVSWEPQTNGIPISKKKAKRSKSSSSLDNDNSKEELIKLDSSELCEPASSSPATTATKDKSSGHDMSWICVECKEAECMIQAESAEFLICDGKCNRIFHYPCAGLNELPPSDQDWICKDCTNQRHQCALCQEYGIDEEDVFLCSKPGCGLFFHESCLSMHNVDIVSRSPKEGGGVVGGGEGGVGGGGGEPMDAPTTIPVFTCPAHSCWTCTQTIVDEEEVDEEASSSKDKEGADDGTAANDSTAPAKSKGKTSGRKKQKKKPSMQKLYFQCKSNSRLFVSVPLLSSVRILATCLIVRSVVGSPALLERLLVHFDSHQLFCSFPPFP
jgi:hypothetical protein